MEIDEKEISLDDIIFVLNKWRKIILIPSFCAAVLAVIYTSAEPRSYESFALVRVGSVGSVLYESVPAINDIMQSLPVRQEIAQNLKKGDNQEFIRSLKTTLECSDENGLLKVRAVSDNPEKAAEIVKAVCGIIMKRHEDKYVNARIELDRVLKYVKETIRPMPLSSGITEFKISKTEIVVGAFTDPDPVPAKRKQLVMIVFFSVLFGMIIVALILEGRKKQ